MKKTAKDMSKVYAKTSTLDLVRNQMLKRHALARVQGVPSYWAKKEVARLEHMIKQIDVELEARALQEPLF